MGFAKKIAADLFAAFTAAAIILSCTAYASGKIMSSRLVVQSRLASALLSQDSGGVMDIVSNPRRFDAFVKFLGAVTAAYINFEMIPLNEAKTFAVIFDCMDEEIAVESFEYQGKSLAITGSAPTIRQCGAFADALDESGHFRSVSVHQYVKTDGDVKFEIVCVLL